MNEQQRLRPHETFRKQATTGNQNRWLVTPKERKVLEWYIKSGMGGFFICDEDHVAEHKLRLK